jgi:WD40 repeat protein
MVRPPGASTFSPDGTRLLAGGKWGQLDVWRVADGMSVSRTQDALRWYAPYVGFAADSDHYVAMQVDATVARIRSSSRPAEPARVIQFPLDAIASGAIAPQRTVGGPWWVAAGSATNTVSLADVGSAVPASKPFPVGREERIPKLALSPDGNLLAVSNEDGLFLWDVSDKAAPRKSPTPLDPTDNRARFMAFSPTGRYLVALTGEAAIYAVQTGALLASTQLNAPGLAAAFSPDEHALFIGEGECGRLLYCRGD